jgi:hypothetical protein
MGKLIAIIISVWLITSSKAGNDYDYSQLYEAALQVESRADNLRELQSNYFMQKRDSLIYDAYLIQMMLDRTQDVYRLVDDYLLVIHLYSLYTRESEDDEKASFMHKQQDSWAARIGNMIYDVFDLQEQSANKKTSEESEQLIYALRVLHDDILALPVDQCFNYEDISKENMLKRSKIIRHKNRNFKDGIIKRLLEETKE